jgi:hypothetical protein
VILSEEGGLAAVERQRAKRGRGERVIGRGAIIQIRRFLKGCDFKRDVRHHSEKNKKQTEIIAR